MVAYDCLRSLLPCRTIFANRFSFRHIQYGEHIVQATMNRFDRILGISLLELLLFYSTYVDCSVLGKVFALAHVPYVALASSAIACMRSQCQASELASTYMALHMPDILLKD